ncbi:S8/S53 family peptidase [Leucobacter japonicus]|uniref:S8/S53 family peptidase n=1 Tax=Leucobacter japonicus TaxID=1461259 RepID=UPI000B2C3056|nr:S8/S53 family peptidase [Leucobacter japonicus]
MQEILIMGRKFAIAGVAIVSAVLAVAATPVAGAQAAPATSDQRSAGLWQVDKLGFDALQASGWTGEGVKIAVIDTFVNPDVPELQGANVQVRGSTCADPATGKPLDVVSDDPALSAHGTNVVSMLVGNGTAGDGGAGARGIAPKAEVWFYGVGDLDATDADQCKLQDPTLEPGGIDLAHDVSWGGSTVSNNPDGAGDATALAARAAIRDGADVVSVSVLSGGGGTDWAQVIFESLIAQVPIVVGVLNPDDQFALVGGPFATNGAFPVNAIAHDGALLSDASGATSFGGDNIAVAAPGVEVLGVGDASGWGPALISGTSYATPLTAGAAALGFQKYPDASRFQVMQAMLRTTGSGGVHDIEWGTDELGAGYLNVAEMLAADPSEFPDENPQWLTDVSDPRCVFRDGKVGTITDQGVWECSWSAGPFPPEYDAYRAVVVDGEPIVVNDRREQTPYSKASESAAAKGQQGADGSGAVSAMPVWAVALIVSGIVALLGVLAVVMVLVQRSRKRTVNHTGRFTDR